MQLLNQTPCVHDKGTLSSANKHPSSSTTVHGPKYVCVSARGFLEILRIEIRFVLVLDEKHIGPCGRDGLGHL